MKTFSTIVVLVGLLTTAIPTAARAGTKKSKSEAPAESWAKTKKGKNKKVESEPLTSDVITALHLSSITVTLYSTHASREYRVTPVTKINVNGNPGRLSDLSTGMIVNVVPAADPGAAATIDARTAPPPSRKESPKKK